MAIEGGAATPAGDGSTTPADVGILNFDNVKDFITRFDTYTTNRRERRKQAKMDKGDLL